MDGSDISVVIPTCGREAELREAVASAAAQTLSPREILVVHDRELSGARLGERFGRVPVRELVNTACPGAPGSRNLGAENAAGRWIAFLDDDDIWDREKLARQAAVVDADPVVEIVYTDYRIFREPGVITADKRLSDEYSADPAVLRDRLLVRPILGSTSSFLLRRDVLLAAGGFDPSMPSAQDYELTLRLARRGTRFACIARPLLYYRSTGSKMSLQVEAKRVGLERVLVRKRELFPEEYARLEPSILAFHHYSLAFVHFLAGDRAEGARLMRLAGRAEGTVRKRFKAGVIIALARLGLLDAVMRCQERRRIARRRAESRELQRYLEALRTLHG